MKVSNKLLVPIDFNEQSLFALRYACGAAKALKQKIMLLYVHEESGFFSKIFASEIDESHIIDKMKQKLEEIAKTSSREYNVEIETFFVKGKVSSKIVEMSEVLDVDIIMMGISNTSDSNNYPIGANSYRVVRASKVPVLTIRNPKEFRGIKSILLPINLDMDSRYKVNQAIRIAKITGAKVYAISGYWDKNIPDVQWKLKAQLRQVEDFMTGFGITVRTAFIDTNENKGTDLVSMSMRFIEDHPDIDLLMVTQSEGDISDLFIDSETQSFIRFSNIPVMSVRTKSSWIHHID